MSDAKLPMWLDKEMRRAMGVNDNTGQAIKMGFTRCYAALLERAPEFDRELAAQADPIMSGEWDTVAPGFRGGAQWQHAQDAAQIAALKAENSRLGMDIIKSSLADVRAENKMLRDFFTTISDNRVHDDVRIPAQFLDKIREALK